MNAEYETGVVIGKFLPPHAGHHHLIGTALSRCRAVTVIVCGKPVDPIPAELRAEWLREIHPSATVLLIDDRYDENDSRVWAENTIGWLGGAPEVVFTSEDYGPVYGAHMGCQHVLVDRQRVTVPCSGTAVRKDPFAKWEYLQPPVRAWFAKRVIIVGAESTGTTTLAMDLAAALDTPWVPEYGREYSAAKAARGESIWHSDEFIAVGHEQNRRENQAARQANRILIGDTNSYATRLWHRRYVGFDLPELDAIADKSPCDLYLLTGDEIPFVQDGLRDGEHIRHHMHEWFVESLESQNVPWLLVQGSREQRLALALAEIRRRWLF